MGHSHPPCGLTSQRWRQLPEEDCLRAWSREGALSPAIVTDNWASWQAGPSGWIMSKAGANCQEAQNPEVKIKRLSEAPLLPAQPWPWGKSARGPGKGVGCTPLITNVYQQSPAPALGVEQSAQGCALPRPTVFGCSLRPHALCVPKVRPPGNPADEVATRSDSKHRVKEGLFEGSKQETGVGC